MMKLTEGQALKMTHAELFKLIATIKDFKPAREQTHMSFDANPNSLVGYTERYIVIFEANLIIVLDCDEGTEFEFAVGDPLVVN